MRTYDVVTELQVNGKPIKLADSPRDIEDADGAGFTKLVTDFFTQDKRLADLVRELAPLAPGVKLNKNVHITTP